MPSWDGDQTHGRAEAERAVIDRLQVLLPDLVLRRVPARLLEPGPVSGVGRLRMADGTTFLVTAAGTGGLGRLTRALVDRRTVLVSSWTRTPAGLHLTLSGAPGRHPVTLLVLGPDQPD